MLQLYGHPASQPSRSVIWACVLQQLPCLLLADPARVVSDNARGQIPVINDDGFELSEMPAILTYLAEKHAWHELYPADLQTRARIAQYLHAHHTLTRLATLTLMAPHVLVAFGGVPTANPLSYLSNQTIAGVMADPDGYAAACERMAQVIDFLERHYLGKAEFIAGTAKPSIADLACYEELGQLQINGVMDLSPHPLVEQWLQRMRQLPHHDAVHRFNYALGDVRAQPNTMARFVAAVEAAMSELATFSGLELG